MPDPLSDVLAGRLTDTPPGQTPAPRPRAWLGAVGGIALAALALCFMRGGWALGLGTPFRPGTGAFSFFSAAILLVLAVLITVQDLRRDGLAERPDWRSFAAIGAALAGFALTAERFGLVPATFLAVLIASGPDRSLSWPGKIVLGGVMAGLAWGLFIAVLGLPFAAVKGV